MSTYTVTEDRGWHSLWRNGCLVKSTMTKDECAKAMAREKTKDCAEAMLALLVESREPLDGDGELESWANRRDDLIRQINGEATCGRCGNPFAPFWISVPSGGAASAICPECSAKHQRKTESA